MKHLKLFENFNSSEYYYKISRDEYREYVTKGIADISEEESLIIKDALTNVGIDTKWPMFTLDIHLGDKHYIRTGPNGCILKLDDEWYLYKLNNLSCYYKCDRIDGLMKCINEFKDDEVNKFQVVENVNNDYYYEIDGIKFSDDRGMNFNHKDLVKIVELFKPSYKPCMFRESGLGPDKIILKKGSLSNDDKRYISWTDDMDISISEISVIGIRHVGIDIYMGDDEWYLVRESSFKGGELSNKAYRCDQLEGLVKLLKDKKVI